MSDTEHTDKECAASFFCNDRARFGSSDCQTQCAECSMKPVAWLHEKHPTAHVITDRVKSLWLGCNPEHVENYTVPLFKSPLKP